MKHKLFAFFGFILGVAALTLIFNFTDPVSIGLFGVVGVFAIVYLLCFSVIYGTAMIICGQLNKKRKDANRINARKTMYVSLVLAVAPVVMMSFSSLGGLNIAAALLVVIIEVVAIFFINKKA
ncbi:MAG: hypothetical protein LBK50_00605 [Candidatus Nomurabacteria bacterium]|jgi:hypothetical protein|nr:hypothetical protein [Candidatus Nomurabacteria bacterium]